MADPNFLLIGAQKSGTTWLAEMLRQHPDVFTPERKELHFFDRRVNYERGMDWYRSHFSAWSGEHAIGESTTYQWIREAVPTIRIPDPHGGERVIECETYPREISNSARLIHEHLPDLKLLVTLRNPVDRAISGFFHQIRMRRLPPTSRILEVGGRYGILAIGFYHAHLSEWLRYFPRERFLFLVYEEDIRRSQKETLTGVFRHLGVDERFVPTNLENRLNARSSHPFLYANYYAPRLARQAFRRFPRLHELKRPRIRLTDEERALLYSVYEESNQQLEGLLGRSLEVWKRPKA